MRQSANSRDRSRPKLNITQPAYPIPLAIGLSVALYERSLEVGRQRAECCKDNPLEADRTPEIFLRDHIDGAMSEQAIAWYYKKPWVAFTPDYAKLKADVGKDWQVRTTRNPNGNLLLREIDEPKAQYPFLFTRIFHEDRAVNFIGWIYGYEGMQECYWDDNMPRPCWKIPWQRLHPPGELLITK